MQQPDWLEKAWRELGVREVAGAGDNKRIVAMFAEVGHAAIRDDEVAWCAAFLGACLERAGHKSTRSLMARSYLSWGRKLNAARQGGIAVLSRGSDPALGHVGFVVGENDDEIFLLGGNQSNAVTVAAFPKSRVLSFRWPEGAADPAAVDSAVPVSGSLTEAALFERALSHVLEMEGGFTNDPHDPGGPTNKGITLDVYARWTGQTVSTATRNRLVGQLKKIPDLMVREIYRTRYWTPAECGRMPLALSMMHFDTAVNHGVGRAIRILQEAVGADIDGEIGPQTRQRVAAKPIDETLIAYANLRRERYRTLDHFWRFGRGWLRRVDFTLLQAGALTAVKMIASPNAAADGYAGDVVSGERKGETTMTTSEAVEVPQPKWWGESVTIWGVVVTALSTVAPVIGPLFGFDITGEMVHQLGQQITAVVQALGGVIGTLLAIYGRVSATQPIARRAVSLKL